MKCEICKQEGAEVAIKQAVDGVERELFVCAGCARRTAGTLVSSLVELLLGAAVDRELPSRDDTACPGCGLPRSEFRKRARVGCARCYETFARELAPMLRDMHADDHHVGKLPARERLGRTRAELERALKTAIETQRYEDAALLRDRLRALDAPAEKPAAGGGHAGA